jgi:hypothetical protein
LAWLRDSQSKLHSCRDFLKSLDEDGIASYTRRECLTILPVITGRLEEADKDNYKIYQETIPTHVPEIKGKQLAKSTPTLPICMLAPKKPVFVGL